MPKRNDLDQRVLGAMSGAERIRLLLRDAGFKSLAAFAASIGRTQQEVSYTINGDREYPEIRDAISRTISLPRPDLDKLIGQKAEPVAEKGAA